MTREIPILLLGAIGLGLAGCQPSHGGETMASPPTSAPGEQALASVPLGAPPGQTAQLGATIANPYEGSAEAVQQGKALFGAMNCAYCHGQQASGLMGPALDTPAWRYGGTPAQIYNSIHDGRPKGMPAWGTSLPPDQIWKLVAYIESLGGAKPPATEAMVQAGGDQPSTTGDEVADQVQTDTAHEALVSGRKAAGTH